jgi:hypothetical protein
LALAVIGLAGCGATHSDPAQVRGTAPTSSTHGSTPGIPKSRPQVIEPTAGAQAGTVAPVTPSDPVGDPNAHAPSISQIRHELALEAVAATPNSAGYINPLPYVTCCGRWERTDQGVDATMPVGAPIVAPGAVKILAVEPDWYLGQPLIYWELLDGADAGRVQYVAEEITDLVRPGTILQQGQPIARFARSGTGIEFGWSTLNGITLAMATTGYEEGQATPAGQFMRAWLNSLGAKAGNG